MPFCGLEQNRTINILIYAFGWFVGMTHARKIHSSLNMAVINIMFRPGSSSLPLKMTRAA